MLTRFVKSPDQVRQLLQAYAAPSFDDIRSLSLTFETDPDVARELIPPPLQPAPEPRVSVSVYKVRRSNCVGPFNGASVNIACTYRGEPGLYCLAMPMDTGIAVIFGRELYAEPKKLADIRLEETEGQARGIVTRHGVSFLEIAGTFDAPSSPSTPPGRVATTTSSTSPPPMGAASLSTRSLFASRTRAAHTWSHGAPERSPSASPPMTR